MSADARNPALDGLRGLAVLLVMAHHFIGAPVHKSMIGPTAYGLAYAGWIGVDLFFVLSGFLITGILLDAKGSQRYFRNFYARRGLRIFPLYYGILLAVFVFVPLFHRFSPEVQAVADRQAWLWCYAVNLNIALESQWLFDAGWLRLGHFWSLAIEEQFYLVWPMLVFLLNRRMLMWLCGLCVAAALATRIGMLRAGVEPTILYVLTVCRMDALAIGAFLAAAVRVAGGAGPLFVPARWMAGASAAVLVGIFLKSGSFLEDLPAIATAGYLFLGLLFGSMVVLCLAPPSRSALAKWMTLRPLRFFGAYGYGLYVFHVLLMPAFLELFGAQRLAGPLGSPGAAVMVFAILATLGSVAAAWLSWHLYESRFLRLKRFFECRSDRSPEDSGRKPKPALSWAAATTGGLLGTDKP